MIALQMEAALPLDHERTDRWARGAGSSGLALAYGDFLSSSPSMESNKSRLRSRPARSTGWSSRAHIREWRHYGIAPYDVDTI